MFPYSAGNTPQISASQCQHWPLKHNNSPYSPINPMPTSPLTHFCRPRYYPVQTPKTPRSKFFPCRLHHLVHWLLRSFFILRWTSKQISRTISHCCDTKHSPGMTLPSLCTKRFVPVSPHNLNPWLRKWKINNVKRLKMLIVEKRKSSWKKENPPLLVQIYLVSLGSSESWYWCFLNKDFNMEQWWFKVVLLAKKKKKRWF